MGNKEELKLLQEQLNGLAKAVESDENLPMNMEDYLVTLNSLKKRIEVANRVPDPDAIGGTTTGRTSSKNPNMGAVPKNIGVMGPIGETGMTATPDKTKPPLPNRRAAIAHTRKLNESGNYS